MQERNEANEAPSDASEEGSAAAVAQEEKPQVETAPADKSQSTSPEHDPSQHREFPTHLIRWAVLVSLVVMLATVGYRALFQPDWVFSVQADTSVVQITTSENKETKWRVAGATICSRKQLEPSIEPLSPPDPESPCRSWWSYSFEDPEQTLVLYGVVSVTLEIRDDGKLFISLREPRGAAVKGGTETDKIPKARLSFTKSIPEVSLERENKLRVNLIFPPAEVDRIFPFSGVTTIGRDVNWSGTSLLTKGKIGVYTADSSADKRYRVDETEVLIGDQVRLDNAKGFARLSRGSLYFNVVAFGAGDSVRIERFGDQGYDVRPRWLSRLTHDPLLLWIVPILAAFITVVATIPPLFKKEASK